MDEILFNLCKIELNINVQKEPTKKNTSNKVMSHDVNVRATTWLLVWCMNWEK